MNARTLMIGLGAVAAASLCGAVPMVFFGTVLSAGDRLEVAQASAPAEDWGAEMEEASERAPSPAAPPAVAGRGAAPGMRARKAEAKESGVVGGLVDAVAAEGEANLALADDEAPADNGGGEASEAARQWFPESFLWAPAVETGDDGVATLDVRVPDQLTTWRVLGLAHDRSGQQAGAVHAFDSRLPVYVEPVVPGWLYAGDVVELPVQAVNTSGDPLNARIVVDASGALSGGGEASVSLAPGGSDVRRIRLGTDGAGTATVSARLTAVGATDAAERAVPVVPAGRPVRTSVGGSLSKERALSLSGPAGADGDTQELTVRVFAGPLSVLQAEVERIVGGATPADGAYGFALASTFDQLADRAGIEADPEVVRRLQLVAWQRIVREARAPDAGRAADLLIALQHVEGHALAEGLRPRLTHVLVEGQRGDGTWARQPNASLQQVLVQTAVAARALPEDRAGARLRASGAIERHAREIDDPYTAAVVLASGLADEGLAEKLRQRVIESVSSRADGSRTVAVPAGVHNAWGLRPSHAEVSAWTALALADTDLPWKGDLVADLMGRYDARWGFGAGRADAVALEAVARLLPGADAPVDVLLVRQGREVARATVDPTQPMVPAVLVDSPRGGADGYEVRLEREVPGLAYVATLASWVPWTGDEKLPGVDLELEAAPLVVGRDSTIGLTLAAPSGEAVTLEQGLPAGATVDEARLAALSGSLTSWEVETDRVRLTTRPFRAGEIMELEVVVRPAFAGRFQTVPLVMETARGGRVEQAPMVWAVEASGPRG